MCRRQMTLTEEAISRIGVQANRLRGTHEKYLRERKTVLKQFGVGWLFLV